MGTARLKIAILLTYAVFAVLLNSVGTVILQSIATFGITKVHASTLEGFKDLSIAIVSFLIAAQLPRFGLRRAMIAGLSIVSCACLAMPLIPSFLTTQLLFLAIGVSFALVKVGVYSYVGLLTDSARGHASLLNLIEGVFTLGILGGYWLFSAFIDPANPSRPSWLHVYYLLSAVCALAALLLATSRFDESALRPDVGIESPGRQFTAMLMLITRLLTIIFVVSIFLYVLVEQGIGSWLPTFNRERLGLDAQMSVQAASIFALGLATGRLGAGLVVRRTGWMPLVLGCIAGMAALILLALPLAGSEHRAITEWSDAPYAAFVLPLIGIFMGPIYPALNSATLSALPKQTHPAMVGLIVVFSALGGTTGSLIVGRTFSAFGGSTAFYLLLVPILLLSGSVYALRRQTGASAQLAQTSLA
jgi:MFS transporter, FHS family, glucose/mannose:H+ symporter